MELWMLAAIAFLVFVFAVNVVKKAVNFALLAVIILLGGSLVVSFLILQDAQSLSNDLISSSVVLLHKDNNIVDASDSLDLNTVTQLFNDKQYNQVLGSKARLIVIDENIADELPIDISLLTLIKEYKKGNIFVYPKTIIFKIP